MSRYGDWSSRTDYSSSTAMSCTGDGFLSENELDLLARLIASTRQIHALVLTAWVLLPDHWHAIVYPRYPWIVSEVMETIKVSATRRINRGRHVGIALSIAVPFAEFTLSHANGLKASFDRALRTLL